MHPLIFVEQMEIESITRFLPEILASLGTCCPWSRHRDTTVDHPAFERKTGLEPAAFSLARRSSTS